MKKNQGFTLIELLVVSTIIVVLSAIGLVSYTNASKGARDSKRKADLETVRQAMVLYRSDNQEYPDGLNYDAVIIQLTGTPAYLSQPTPQDPKLTPSYYIDTTGTKPCICADMEKSSNAFPGNCSAPATFINAYCVPTL